MHSEVMCGCTTRYTTRAAPLLLLHGGLFDIHQQFGALLPGKLDDPPTTEEAA